MAFPYKITVFTPTYNRAYIIENLYRSLQRQTFLDFEWLVVDDGSSDDTEQLFSRWSREETRFPIRYFRQENGGKCRAINRALKLAQGELFFTVDSDDYLTDDALEKVAGWFASIDPEGPVQGVAANKGDSPEHTVNHLFPEEYLDRTFLDVYTYRKNGERVLDGERAYIFFTAFHRRYPYPEFPGENFMTEAVAWNRMAHDGYRMHFYNDIIWVYAYKEDGLTMAGGSVFLNNPQGYGLWLREKAAFLHIPPWKKLAMWLGFVRDLDGRCTDRQIAAYIGMPYPVAAAMRYLRKLKHFILKCKR